jgi:hypothetical protein
MKAAMKVVLKQAFTAASLEWKDDYCKEFMTYVNELSDAEFAECVLEGHMTNFASTFSDEEEEETTTPAQGGGGAEAAPALRVLTVPELLKQFKAKNLTQVRPGVFVLTKTGETITGPSELDDGDYEDRKLDGKTYKVCTETSRVYLPIPGAADKFVGFWGVGEW